MTQIQTHFPFHRLCHVVVPVPFPNPCRFYPRYFHVFMSVFPFSSPLWWLVFAARNYPENILKLRLPIPCTSWDGQLWRHFSWWINRLPRRWTLHPWSYPFLPALRSLQGLKYLHLFLLNLNAPLPLPQHTNLLKCLTNHWEPATQKTVSVPKCSELPQGISL